MAELKFIVEKLKQPPFNMQLELVPFSMKPPEELLALLGQVCAAVQPRSVQGRDLSREAPEQTAQRCLEFVRSVKYQHGQDQLEFREAIPGGDKDAIYPLLKWVLEHRGALEKRAFVGYYLSEVQVPQELFSDQDIMELHQEQKAYQAQFIESHKHLDALKNANKDPVVFKDRIGALERERENLRDRIQEKKQRVQKLCPAEQLTEYVEFAQLLRAQKFQFEDDAANMQKEHERLEEAKMKFNKASTKLREVHASSSDGSPAALLAALREEAQQNRFLAKDKLPKELQVEQEKMQKKQQVLAQFTSESESNRAAELGRLERRHADLDGEVRVLREKAAAIQAMMESDANLRQQTQVAKMAARKKDDALNKVERLSERSRALASEVEDRSAQAEQGRNQVLKGDDWKQKSQSVRQNLKKYKEMKAVLDSINGELYVLMRTEGILMQQEAAVSEKVSDAEKQRGVAGFQATQQTLEEVSMAKGAVDEAEGQTLEEISEFVKEINMQIKERKSQLAPQIKELRTVRAKFQEMEADHTEKKKQYEATVAGYESKSAKLHSEVKGYTSDCSTDETQYHYINCMASVMDAQIKRVMSSRESSAWKDQLTKKANEDEEEHKQLKMRLKHVKDNIEPNIGQIGLLRDLKRLMEVKLSCSKSGNVDGGVERRGMGAFGTADVMSF